ncbi:hypothetical protein M0805_000983 [Coniferiporia weirii]|nr:hypothetical protein M0805_000983 [Coniferiporia weirii]
MSTHSANDEKDVSEERGSMDNASAGFDAGPELAHIITGGSYSNSTILVGDNQNGFDLKPRILRYERAPWYLRVPFCEMKTPPSPPMTIDDAPLIPEATAPVLSRLFFSWIWDILRLGYNRPLEAPDLYKLQDHRSAEVIANMITESFERRVKAANAYNECLVNGKVSPGFRPLYWMLRGNAKERERLWRESDGKKSASLVLALNDSIAWWFWSAGVLKVLGDSAQMCTPLLVKAIINFAEDSYKSRQSGTHSNAPSTGKGVGLAIGLFILQLFSFLCTSHFFYRSSSTGVLLRGGLITAIYSRSLRLSNRARSTLTTGKLVNHISTDVSRIDFCCQFFHMFWTAPIQMILCLILLLLNLGPGALAGYAPLVFVTPIQARVMKRLFRLRQNSMIWTDKRAKLLQEILGGIKVIKLFSWEVPFLRRIEEYRGHELHYVRSLLILRSAINAVAFTLPIFAAVLSFVVYSLSGHSMDPAIIFSSFTLFQLLRMPLMFFPMAINSITDAANATERLYGVFVSELLAEQQNRDPNLDVAVRVKSASFTWDASPAEVEDLNKRKKDRDSNEMTTNADKEKEKMHGDSVFQISTIDLEIPHGSLVAIVGPVGSGKSSLLQGLIGEMRQTSGTVSLGGTVGYCPQNAWIQNATIRENICFGRPFEKLRYWRAVHDSCLERDLELLPDYDMTEVGEKGISLSGGQKQRLNICRSIYCNTDIQIFDDPLSALDAHVGKAVFQRVLQPGQQGKTRILVTHALHFLPHVDCVYVMSEGQIVERGTYAELLRNEGAFAKFVQEFGSSETESGDEAHGEGAEASGGIRKAAAPGAAIMQAEERVTGAVSKEVYATYIKAGKGRVVLPLLILCLVLTQGSSVMSSYWLVYWQDKQFDIPQGAYMAVYAALGISQASCTFLSGAMFAVMGYFASNRLHHLAIQRVLLAPMSFFETTPLGRIMNRFAKDIDTVDNVLSDSLRMFSNTFSQIIGAVILISIVVPWFLIVMCIFAVYYYMALFYRSSARELKRLDALLRSSLYAHFSESLSGLATIRAYGEMERFERENRRRMDIENRAYWLTVTNQQWL